MEFGKQKTFTARVKPHDLKITNIKNYFSKPVAYGYCFKPYLLA